MRLLDLKHKRFGSLVVTGKIKRSNGQIVRQCRCDCGQVNWVQTGHLTHGRTTNCGCARKLGVGQACRNRVWQQYKHQAQQRGLSWRLTEALFDKLIHKPCHFCGQSYVNEARHLHANGSFRYNGIDRLNNDVGYTRKNCVPCCKFCNRAKSTGTAAEFTNWLRGIVR